MSNKWKRLNSESETSPVEMRFIDLFMTAIGALVMIAGIMALLPKSMAHLIAKQNIERKEWELAKADLIAKNESVSNLNNKLSEENENLKKKNSYWDVGIVKRWIYVNIQNSNCIGKPILYLRPIGKLIDVYTGKDLGEAKEFDASKPDNFESMYGDDYRNERTEFIGTINGGSYQLIITLSEIAYSITNNCNVQLNIKYYGVNENRFHVHLDRLHPYSLVGVVGVDEKGLISFSAINHTKGIDAQIIADFNKKQSNLMCKNKGICDTSMAIVESK